MSPKHQRLVLVCTILGVVFGRTARCCQCMLLLSAHAAAAAAAASAEAAAAAAC